MRKLNYAIYNYKRYQYFISTACIIIINFSLLPQLYAQDSLTKNSDSALTKKGGKWSLILTGGITSTNPDNNVNPSQNPNGKRQIQYDGGLYLKYKIFSGTKGEPFDGHLISGFTYGVLEYSWEGQQLTGLYPYSTEETDRFALLNIPLLLELNYPLKKFTINFGFGLQLSILSENDIQYSGWIDSRTNVINSGFTEGSYTNGPAGFSYNLNLGLEYNLNQKLDLLLRTEYNHYDKIFTEFSTLYGGNYYSELVLSYYKINLGLKYNF